jgi:PST family polysaccharide transporter
LGDVIKIASFILSYVMLAKAMTRLFVISECVFAVSYLALVYRVHGMHFGLIGAMYAFTGELSFLSRVQCMGRTTLSGAL